LNPSTCGTGKHVVEAYLKKQIETLLDQLDKKQAERMENEDDFKYKLPLLRLKIEYSGEHSVIGIAKFGEQFKDKIANRYNFLHFWKRSPQAVEAKAKRAGVATDKVEKEYVYAYNHEEGPNMTLFNVLE
jgi:hypothetical protein